jgi:hypothetical protein
VSRSWSWPRLETFAKRLGLDLETFAQSLGLGFETFVKSLALGLETFVKSLGLGLETFFKIWWYVSGYTGETHNPLSHTVQSYDGTSAVTVFTRL